MEQLQACEAAVSKRLDDEREDGEPIMERALREHGRLPANIAAEICVDPMAELTRLRDRRKTR
jgi:hypothetical protein